MDKSHKLFKHSSVDTFSTSRCMFLVDTCFYFSIVVDNTTINLDRHALFCVHWFLILWSESLEGDLLVTVYVRTYLATYHLLSLPLKWWHALTSAPGVQESSDSSWAWATLEIVENGAALWQAPASVSVVCKVGFHFSLSSSHVTDLLAPLPFALLETQVGKNKGKLRLVNVDTY